MENVLAYQRLQQLPKVAAGEANKVWFLPAELSGLASRAQALLPPPP